MENYLVMGKNEKLIALSKELGFTRSFFNEDFVILEIENKKELLKKIKSSKKTGRKVFVRVSDESVLRFVLEKTNADGVLGMEKTHPKDATHYVRGGLDQIMCRIAAKRGMKIVFSFSDILNSSNRSKLLRRMMFNTKLCRKYKVKMLFSSFVSNTDELRSAKDLEAMWKVLG